MSDVAMKTARDANSNAMPFGTLVTSSYTNITTTAGEQIDTLAPKAIRIAPMANDAWVQISSDEETGTVLTGAFVPFGGSITLVIPKGYWICSDTSINVVPYGYA